MNIRITFLAIASLAAMHAYTANMEEPLQRQVSYAGLDLTQEPAVKTLYRRIKTAAESVCYGLYTREPGHRRHLWQKCVADAVSRAIADVDAPALTAYYQTKVAMPGRSLAVAGEPRRHDNP